jgi:hypothetical protein
VAAEHAIALADEVVESQEEVVFLGQVDLLGVFYLPWLVKKILARPESRPKASTSHTNFIFS